MSAWGEAFGDAWGVSFGDTGEAPDVVDTGPGASLQGAIDSAGATLMGLIE